jgi:hypothetical protein
MMQERLDWVVQALGADLVVETERIQSLWSGYGEILRIRLSGDRCPEQVVVKRVSPPSQAHHPRGWHSDRGHERKLRSYEVEHRFYRDFSQHCAPACRVPQLLAAHEGADEWVFVFEDLQVAGTPFLRTHLDKKGVGTCLSWLANFHATFLGVSPQGLWPVGTYWHLDTRPDELEAMQDGALRNAASAIDARLKGAHIKTLVHGDAKVANFCFSGDNAEVAAVDFQYVGGGCGVKDVAYFLGSVLHGDALDLHADSWLDVYFENLADAVGLLHAHVDVSALEAEWRALYPWAWADFERFLDGWAPGHWKRSPYAQRLTNGVLRSLQG